MKKEKPIRKKTADELTDIDKFIIIKHLEFLPKIYEKAKEHRKQVLEEKERRRIERLNK